MKKTVKTIELTWEETTSFTVERYSSHASDFEAAVAADENSELSGETYTDEAHPEYTEVFK